MSTEGNGQDFAADIKDLGDKIVALSVAKAVQLGDYLEKVHGIKPAGGGVMVAAAPGGGGGEPAAKKEEQTEFTVSLDGFDAAITLKTRPMKVFVEQPLFSDGFVCVVRRGHPVLRQGRFNLQRYLALEHLLVAPGGTPGNFVDTELSRRGLARRVALQISSFWMRDVVVRAARAMKLSVATWLPRNPPWTELDGSRRRGQGP